MIMDYITKGFIKVGATLKNIANIWVKVDGAPRKVLLILEKKAGIWEEVYHVNAEIKPGIIAIWSGTEAEIPEGWYLCDGTNGTPNLVDYFVMGDITSGQKSDVTTHVHSVSEEGHAHTTGSDSQHTHPRTTSDGDFYGTLEGAGLHYVGGTHTHTTNNISHTHEMDGAVAEPPYYELAYIMKG